MCGQSVRFKIFNVNYLSVTYLYFLFQVMVRITLLCPNITLRKCVVGAVFDKGMQFRKRQLPKLPSATQLHDRYGISLHLASCVTICFT